MNIEPLIQVKELVVGHDRRAILPAVTFDVLPGEVWGLIGANGSGKTTLLRTMLALIPSISGAGEQKSGLKIGYVPQRSSLDLSVPSRVIDIVRGGADQGWSFLKPTHLWSRAESIERALAEAGVGELRNVQFAELSEGQKQRVLVARALVSEPELLVLDEPTSAMDITAERAVFELIERVVKARKLAVLLVSHHLPVLGEFATHAVYVDRDAQVIVPGDIQTVCQCRECKTRYGDVLGVLHDQLHENNPDHDCDHDHAAGT